MNVSMRRLGLVGLTALAVCGFFAGRLQAQAIPIGAVPNPGLNPNPAVNPVAAVHDFGNVSALSHGLVMSPFSGMGPLNFGAGFGPLNSGGGYLGIGGGAFMGMGAGMGFRGGWGGSFNGGYGSLAASYANGGRGYNSLLGAYLGLGYGAIGSYYSGLNTAGLYGGLSAGFQGYLSGAASVTNANANYWRTIANARLIREQARQERLRTRRAMIEEADYERAHMPDPEKIRQAAIERELDRARNSPPLTEIWSGRALNSLLRHAIAQQGQGSKGPNVPLNEDTLNSINPTVGNTRGNIGLLVRDNGNLQWPQPLSGEMFKDAREDLSRRMRQAFSSGQRNRGPDESTVNDLQNDLKKLQGTLDANISALSPDQYNEGRRYLRDLNNTITALKDRNAVNLITGAWKPKGKNVAELVQHMRDKGLWFAPATPGDEPAYTSLYYALAAFDAGLPRSSGGSDSSDSRTNSGSGGSNGATNPR